MADGSQSLSFRRMHVAIIPALALPGLWIRRAKQCKIPLWISATQRQVHGTPLIESFRRHIICFFFLPVERNKGNLVELTNWNPGRGKLFISSPKRPDPLWGPLTPLCSGYRVLFPPVGGGGVKRPEREAEAVTPLNVEVNEWSYISTPPYAFMACVGVTIPFTFLSYVGLYLRVKFTLEDATKAQNRSRCITIISLTSALDGVVGQRHAPSTLSPAKTR
jgi:hypothetical protein